MSYENFDYRIERECSDSNICTDTWYRVSISQGSRERDYSLCVRGRITIDDGKVVSINGNGRTRRDFGSAIISIHSYRSFDRASEREAMRVLEELVCAKKAE
jgi:hypothetical protein